MTAETGSELKYDRDVIGVEVEVGSLTITRDQIRKYCEVVGETNSLYTDDGAAKEGRFGEIIAPTGLLQTMHLAQGLDAKVEFGNTGFHAGQRMEFFEPIRVGDIVTARAQVKEVYEKTGRSGSMVFTVTLVTYRNQRGEPVMAMEHSFVRREV